MTTTYVRLKNRRGNKADLPTPLAEGELGFALDTRELYIGGGNQDSKNRMVQVNNFLNAQNHTQSDINTRLVVFKLAETESVVGDGTNSNLSILNSNTPLSLPSTKSTPVLAENVVVTKFNINNIPETISNTIYTVSTAGTDLHIDLTSTSIPEANSVIVVSKWTTDEIVSEIANAVPSIETDQSSANNQLYIDLTTGTGWIDIGATGNQASVISAVSNLDIIASADTNTNLNILGSISDLPYSSRSIEVDGNLLVDLDSPQQAVNLVTFLNASQGVNESTVANNIKIFTQDSRPSFENNVFVNENSLLKLTATANATTNLISFDVSDTDTMFFDYSIQFGSDKSIGTMRVITDGSTVSFVDDRTDINDTSDITFNSRISGTTIIVEAINANVTTDARISYILKRWLTS